MLQLYDLNRIKIQGLIKYKDLKVEKELSGEEILSFSYPQNLSENIKEETYVRTKENEYVIKEVSKSDDWTGFVAKVNVETIKGNPFNHYESKEQTCTYAVNLALAGTGWTIGACDVTKRRTVRKANCSSYEILQEIRKVYRCDFRFNAIEKKIYIYQSMGSDKGVYFIYQLNLKKLDTQSNSHDFCTRIIPFGKDGLNIKAINNGKEYVENYQYSSKIITKYWEDNRYTVVESLKEDAELKLKEISTPRRAYKADIIDLARVSTKYTNILEYSLGDTITLISKDKKVKEKQRIIKLIEYPDEPEKNSCEIANRTLTLEDLQVDFIEATDTVNSVTTTDGMLDNSKIDFNPIRMEVESIVATKIDVQELNAVEIRVGNLIGTKANITQLDAEVARINQAFIKTATIENLNATNGKITLLETKVGSIDTILSKEIFAELISAGKIVAGSSIIAEGAIGSAQISSLSATKLSAGIIDATVITVKNLNADNITVGSINGKRIAEGAIDNSKVAEGANISGNKLNINDVIVNINGSTTQINGTKIQVGDRTLDLELSTQKIVLEENKTTISKQQATINAMDNAIKLKVDNQTFNNFKSTTEGNIVTVTTNLNKATSSIDVLQKSIALKVSQTDIDKSIKELEIGGRNYVRRLGGEIYDIESIYPADKQWIKYTMTREVYGLKTWIVYDGPTTLRIASIPIENDTTYTWSFIMYTEGESKRISCSEWDGTSYGHKSYEISKVPKRISHTFTANKNSTYEILHISGLSSTANNYLADFKLEKGNKATDWTPAPEDIDQAINTVETKINTKVGEINVTLDGITTRVGKTENASTVIDGKVTALSTRVTTAETKLTDTSIISTVRNSTAYKGDLNGKANQTALTTAESKIVQLADLISHKVESKDFASYRTQTDKAITDRVSKGEFGSYFKQSADSFDFGFSGGVNLLKNSNFALERTNWTFEGGMESWIMNKESQYNLFGVDNQVMIDTKVSNVLYQWDVNARGGGDYTVSLDYNCYVNVKFARIVIAWRDKTKELSRSHGPTFLINDKNCKMVYTATAPAGTQYCVVMVQHGGAKDPKSDARIRMANLMMVEGKNPANWAPHPSEFNNTSVTITDAEGLVVRNNAISVISKSGRTAFSVDDEGYIMNEWGVSTRVKPGSTISVAGKVMADDKCSTLLRAFGIWHESIDSKYNMRIGSKSEIWFKNLADDWQDTRCRWSMANQFRTTYNNDAGVILRENTVDSGTGRLWLNWGGGKPGHIAQTLVGDGMQAGSYGELHCGSFYAHGLKNRAVETEHFGTRALGAYETPTPYFGDISRQVYEVIDGQCIVPLEPIFKETITSTGEYQVFFSKYGPGDIWTAEMYPTYFIVKGANIKFSWEIKAIQRGYENNRLEQVQI